MEAPVAAPGRVIRDGRTAFIPETHIFLSVREALRHRPKHVLWTTDVCEELPIKMAKTGVAATMPVTLTEAFAETVRKFGLKPALAYKPPALSAGKFRVFDWQQYWNEACRFAKALISVGHQPRDRVAVMGCGAAFWHIAFYGTVFADGVVASIYATNGVEATEYILRQSSAVVAIVDTVENLEKILAAKRAGGCPNIRHIVIYMEDPPSGPGYQSVWRWSEFVRLGHAVSDGDLSVRMDSQTPGVCCQLVYTSGTTGMPKAVMLSHDNCIWTTYSLLQMVHFTSDERVVSFLPLSHIAPQIIDLFIPLLTGCCTYFAQPDALRGSLIVTLQEVKPTFFFAVPRVYEKMEERLKAVVAQSSGLRRRFSDWVKANGLRGTLALLRGEQPATVYSLLRSTILKRIRLALGLDHCKAMASGAAPLQSSTQNYFLSLGMPICDMYGMSESTGPQTSNAVFPGWFKVSSAGVPLPGTEMMIDKAGADGVGEVCFRGRNIFMGYFDNEEATIAAIDKDGFLHSGDMGFIDEDGFLRITGRLKELIVTAGGENIPPLSIEDRIKLELPFVSNSMVVGEKRNFLTVLIALKTVADAQGNPTEAIDPGLEAALQARGSAAKTVFQAKDDEVLRGLIQEGIDRVNEKAISRAQRVWKFRIIPQDFTQVGGELTPTLKLKRNVVAEKYRSLIDAMYEEASANHAGNEMKPTPTAAKL